MACEEAKVLMVPLRMGDSEEVYGVWSVSILFLGNFDPDQLISSGLLLIIDKRLRIFNA